MVTDSTNTSNMFNISIVCMSGTIASEQRPLNLVGQPSQFTLASFSMNSISPRSI